MKCSFSPVKIIKCSAQLTLCLLGNFACSFAICYFFSKSAFSKNSSRNTIRVSNSLDPIRLDILSGLIFDLGPNCLQKLSADDISRQSYANQIIISPIHFGLILYMPFFAKFQYTD